MAEIFKIDLDYLKKHKLSIQFYISLYYFYHFKSHNNDLISQFNNPSYGHFEKAQELAYIKILYKESDITDIPELFNKSSIIGYELRDKIRNLFEGKKDYFLEWLGKFPIKTPSGRYLSTKDEDTIMGTKLRSKWKKFFKNDAIKMQKAIRVLEAEMDWRRINGKFEFMHNAETWLNQGDFEKYEYLLKDIKKVETKIREDFE